jgi:predicted secreted protein
MKPASAIAVYFIIWWAVLFAVLPFGIRSAHEAGANVEAGHDAGAPVNPRLLRKAAITTCAATVLFAVFYWAKTSGLLGV